MFVGAGEKGKLTKKQKHWKVMMMTGVNWDHVTWDHVTWLPVSVRARSQRTHGSPHTVTPTMIMKS